MPELSEVTPMMQNYLETKKQYSDCILFYRLGDFYEMFFEDAVLVSKELELTLTGKSCGMEERAPMCGVPFHAADNYIARLVAKGYKVAICEQVEDPKLAKGLVKREVIRVVTPGTNMNMTALEANKNNFLFCIFYDSTRIGLSIADITTGDFYVTEPEDLHKLRDEIMKFEPREIICNDAYLMSGEQIDVLRENLHAPIDSLDNRFFEESRCIKLICEHFKASSLIGLGLEDFPSGALSAGALLGYLQETQMNDLQNITRIIPYLASSYMLLDSASRRNLELTETLRDKQKRGSLLWVLDKTRTAMGGRLLRTSLEQPLIDKGMILKRLDAIEELCGSAISRDEIREYLNPVYDLERLITRITYKTANPRDLLAFKSSVSMLPAILTVLQEFKCEELTEIREGIDPMTDLCGLIESAIADEPPLSVRDGDIIRDGFNEEVDRLRHAKHDGKTWLMELETAERERTGIKTLHIKYHKAFGYYYEVSHSYTELVPEDYIRRQTLANAERFTNAKLKELEDTILNAEDKLVNLEYSLFCDVRDAVGAELLRIQKTAKEIAKLDVYAALSLVSERNHYVRPSINDKGVIKISEGRHPVVEQMLENDLFIPNDTLLDQSKNCVNIITGPNMAGKSTYMRQVALIVLMAQVGCFVPAREADLCVVDRIFTRVGASDDLASGQSTFMVEMNEVSNILRNATPKSLLILDEIGRGTSTFDGLSIAWAVVEHVSNRKILGAKTLFATHYHELTELEGKIDNVNNYCVAVKESGDGIVFLRKIVKGGADRSYGIQVARLAGLPDMVIDRALEIAEQLSDNDITERIQSITVGDGNAAPHKKVKALDEVDLGQMSFFDTVSDEDVIQELMDVEITTLTPLDAMNVLYRLQSKLKNRFKL
jgi:DNA mismatch repair protein MutS